MPRLKSVRLAAGLAILATLGFYGTPAGATDQPATLTADALVDRHIVAFLSRDWDKAILDYADDAVFVLPGGPIEGKAAILAFFHSLDAQQPAPVFTASKVAGTRDVGLEDWVMNPGHPGAIKGRDVFVIRNGKISVQTTIGLGPVAP